jgi:adenine-specific DNA methylase
LKKNTSIHINDYEVHMAPEDTRLIEVAFPLKQASLDSVHEKNVRHGHISTLHIWPARRPLAACRAALIATLLPDPGDPAERKRILEKLGGSVVEVVKKKKLPSGKVEEKVVEETVGGVLHWGRESSPDLEWFRQEIRKAYGGRAPKVLDPFAGGGAIPLEAMRLGCEVTAVDINPVAWFILKCTLEYPQKLAGQYRPLPKFALESPEFMASFFKSTGTLTKKQLERNLNAVQLGLFPPPDVDLAWHVRAWGWWVLQRAKADLERFYSVVDGKPTVAYLWARTVRCKNCRATVPLLKTRWLCKKDRKRILLTMEPNADKTGVVFGVQTDVPVAGGNAAQRREHDRKVGHGTMSPTGATCPFCGRVHIMGDLRIIGQAQDLGEPVMTAVVVEGQNGKEYRTPTEDELKAAATANHYVEEIFADIPSGIPEEPTPGPAGTKTDSSALRRYGFFRWRDIYTARQLCALGTFLTHTRAVLAATRSEGYPVDWCEAISAYLALVVDRIADRGSTICHWDVGPETVANTFTGYRFPMSWDFAETGVVGERTGSYTGQLEWVALYTEHATLAITQTPTPRIVNGSATTVLDKDCDVIITDPPYYDAIPYANLMDFFYVWMRRSTLGISDVLDAVFRTTLSIKWDHDRNDGELIDDPHRFQGDQAKARQIYEDGMFRAFQSCHDSLRPEGRFVIVFANKQPNAWETLVSAIIRAGFVVDGSWPIQTEMGNRTRALSSSALSSSVWLVCKKRPEAARPGWDNRVLEDMRERIGTRLREFWDAGIQGPDFVWAATGPALEAYSKHPAVKKANDPGQLMTVSEFLRHVRRIVVDFVVGRVLSRNGGADSVSGLDDVTTYYLLHRHDFGMEDAPSGACILYAVSCNLSDSALADQFDLLVRTGGRAAEEGEEEEAFAGAEAGATEDGEPEEGTGSKVKLKAWHQRKRKSLGHEAPGGRPVPLIDQVHRLMHLWKTGEVVKVDEYLDAKGLRKSALFHQLLQALIELSAAGSEERSLLESLSNHVAARGATADRRQLALGLQVEGENSP